MLHTYTCTCSSHRCFCRRCYRYTSSYHFYQCLAKVSIFILFFIFILIPIHIIINAVNDRLVQRLVSSPRFSELEFLSLESCMEITNKTLVNIQRYCPNLETLLLTNCLQITATPITELVHNLPYLHTLELWGASIGNDTDRIFSIDTELHRIRPSLDLGKHQLMCCSARGVLRDGQTEATCRHEGGFHTGRGCWGSVRGRIVWSNNDYHFPGNFPQEVLYSCHTHAEDDAADEDLDMCQYCESFFHEDSMYDGTICRVCHDNVRLRDRKLWVQLTRQNIERFNFSDIVHRCFLPADRRNLPTTLKSYGTVECALSYQLDPELLHSDDIKEIQEGKVPVLMFIKQNRWKVEAAVNDVRERLLAAAEQEDTRALLCFDEKHQVEVLADKSVIVDGEEGESYLHVTVRSWIFAADIFYPLASVMLFTLLLVHMLDDYVGLNNTRTSSSFSHLIDGDDGASKVQLNPAFAMVMGFIFLVFVAGMVVLAFRYREQCDRIFRRLLVMDILIMFVICSYMIAYMGLEKLSIVCDFPTVSVAVWNFASVGLYTLYYPVPRALHHFYLIFFNILMSVCFIAIFGPWLLFFVLFIASLADILSELRPHLRVMGPFLAPADPQLEEETPRIFYPIGELRIRHHDLMWYGLMMGLVQWDYLSVVTCFTAIMASICIFIFIFPFFSKRFTPLPVALALTIMLSIMQPVLSQYLYAINWPMHPMYGMLMQ